MDKVEYWLLHSVVRDVWPLHYLVDKHRVTDLMNMSWHGLATSELHQRLHYLFQRGDLTATYMNAHGDLLRSFLPMHQEVERAMEAYPEDQITSDTILCYRLTAQGGTRWETLAQPRWEQYIDESYWSEAEAGEMIGLERAFMTQYVKLWVETSYGTLHEETVVWDELRPWWATYWKQFPCGQRVRFRCTPRRVTEMTDPEMVKATIHRWHDYVQSRQWYTNYLEC